MYTKISFMVLFVTFVIAYSCRDVQASSILLDDKFEVRLGSLSEVCTQEGDNHPNRISKLLRLPQ